ncbi:hypothetical protein Avbf_17961 [Armadillidium vulgare]|nr:hypothetical protein Avbf_17961 [Armadillidium vulgare]
MIASYKNEKIFITMNDMIGILQEEERSFEDSENFSVKLICIFISHYIFTFHIQKGIRNFCYT